MPLSREAVFIVDQEWKIVHASSGSGRMFGRSNGSLMNLSVLSLLPERHQANQKALWSTASAGRDSIRVDALGSKRGEEFPLKVEVARVPGNDDFACIIFRDLRAGGRQAQKMEALGLLAGGVAHDFNNALTAIIGFASGVRDDLDLDSPLRADLEEVLVAADSASQLTKQLLSFSRQRPVQSAVIEVNQSVVELQRLLRKTLPASVSIVVTPDRSDVHVRFELSELHQILINLASNASDAMPNGGQLSMVVEVQKIEGRDELEDGEYAVMAVTDSGTGIAKEILDNVFDPFFSTKGEDGTGLGLSTCFGLARQAGGTLMVKSTEGEGSTFSLYVPTCVAAPLRSLTTTSGMQTQQNYGTALVVEDQAAVRKYLIRAVKRAGLKVVSAASAEEALRVYESMDSAPALLVSDVMLSGRSGTDLAGTLREKNPELKVLLTSGFIRPERGAEDLTNTNTHFLGKPYTVKQMRGAIDRLLNPPNRLEGHIAVVATSEARQKEIAELFCDVNLPLVFLSDVQQADSHLRDASQVPVLVCIDSKVAQLGDGQVIREIRKQEPRAELPILILDTESDPYSGELSARTALLCSEPNRLNLSERLLRLGLQLASE